MADADQITKTQVKEIPEQNLKYLEFVQVAALHLVLYVSKIYDYAKENSGPLKTGVQTVEGTVKTVVGPVYQKFHDVPNELLKFVDRKVDDTVNKVESHIPPVFKQMSSQARSVASEVKNAGLIDTASELAKTVYVKYEPIAKGVYNKYEPVAEHYAVSAWHSLNNLPLFPQVAQAVIPTATYVTERYNQTVLQSAKKGFKVASYFPLVPTEKIAKVFNNSTYQPMSAAGTKTIPNDGGVAAN